MSVYREMYSHVYIPPPSYTYTFLHLHLHLHLRPRILFVCVCCVQGRAIEELMRVLGRSTYIQTVDLGNNQLGRRGAVAVASILLVGRRYANRGETDGKKCKDV